MKLLIAGAVLFSLGEGALAQLPGGSSRADRWAASFKRTFEKVDYAPLHAELVRLQPEIEESEADRLLRRNLRFVLDNQLNRQRMLIAPRAQEVVDSIAELLAQANEISETLAAGRRMAVQHRRGERDLPIEVIQDVGELARELSDDFEDLFVEIRANRIAIGVPSADAAYPCFIYFLLEGERLSRRLGAALESYFLTAHPGIVDAQDYRRGSVMALTKGLVWLSDETFDHLQEIQ